MKVITVVGITNSGKTTTIENIIKELVKRRYLVGSVKEIHHKQFTIDTEGTNTYRHYKAGAQQVTARGCFETDILFKRKLPVKDILKFYDQEYVVLEGVEDFYVPKIITAHTEEDIEDKLDGTVFAISGRVSNKINEYKGIPVINSVDNCEALVDLVEEKTCHVLPNLPPQCCGKCGFSCKELLSKIITGEKKRDDCPLGQKDSIKLSINGEQIDMVPFVQNILRNAVEGVVKELDGYQPNKKIEITIGE